MEVVVKKINQFQNWICSDPTDVEVCEETFNTSFVPLSYADAHSLILFHDNQMTEKDRVSIEELTRNIQSSIDAFEIKAAFVRLSTLSPKDATLKDGEKLFHIMTQELVGISYENPSEAMIAVNRSLYLASKVSTGVEAMELFRKSDRVSRHLEERLKNLKGDHEFQMNIVVREWNEIKPEFEFRGFVYGGRLNALTHYYKFLYVEQIAARKSIILGLINDYFLQVKDLITLTDYVIDFSVDISNKVVKVIELNPWSEAASSCLFNWELESDRTIMTGDAPFEFRILDRPIDNVFDNLSPKIRMIYEMVHDYGNLSITMKNYASDFVNSYCEEHKKKYHKLIGFHSETKKYEFKILTMNLNKIFNDLPVTTYGLVHWELTEAFFNCISVPSVNKNIKLIQNFDEKNKDYLFPTLLVICLYEIESKNGHTNMAWKRIIDRAYAFVYFQISKQMNADATISQKREELLIRVHNNLVISKEQLCILKLI